MDQEKDKAELARLTRRVLDNAHRTKSKPSPRVPASFLYWCELLQRIAPMQSDWETLTGSIAAIARGIAALYNDGRDPDWRAAERVMRDCVPYVTAWLLERASSNRVPNVQELKMYGLAGYTIDRPMITEIARLTREGVLHSKRKAAVYDSKKHRPWKYTLGAGDWMELLDRGKEILI
jgi:hypothetical protein